LSGEIGDRLMEVSHREEKLPINELARPSQTVLNCILIEPNQWWVGVHRVDSVPQRWAGGVPNLIAPDEMISRAYLKINEALAWSRLPTDAGDAFVEIGCAPGGASQALLDRGFIVTGIDPADVDERLRKRDGFTHIRKRGADLRRREYQPFRWLAADLNVAPSYTLETVENIVMHDGINMAGLLLTLKLPDRPLYGQIGEFIARVRGWGFEDVRVRQLAFGRQEVCLAALRSKSLRRGRK
jgi:23S rRNA (cytidine2498-2'-O)-methyltransferase